MNKSYISNFAENTIYSCAGFFTNPFENWWIPIAFISVPQIFIDRFYKKRQLFIDQCNSCNGDKTESTSNFLNTVLPRLVQEAIQGCKLLTTMHLLI